MQNGAFHPVLALTLPRACANLLLAFPIWTAICAVKNGSQSPGSWQKFFPWEMGNGNRLKIWALLFASPL